MGLRSVMVQLRPDQIEQLDRAANRQGTSRSRLVRDAVDASLRPRSDRSVAEQYALAYPDGDSGVDEWGDLDAWHQAAADARVQGERDPW
jgi:hypothetical protein